MSMSNIIEFPIERRYEQMAIEAGFDTYDRSEMAELETEAFLGELLQSMFKEKYNVADENYIYDVSFLYESLKSFIYKMHDCDHPIQTFAQNLYFDAELPNDSQLEFDF